MNRNQPDNIVLIGAGIMSATLGILLKRLLPNCNIKVIERLGSIASESSDAMNNAGTGHSAFCELNYSPELEDGTIDIHKAIKIAASYEQSKSFWAHLVENNCLPDPVHFINRMPHMSFVWGAENAQFLEKRYEKMKESPFFKDMIFSKDRSEIKNWIPLVMDGRNPMEEVAATKVDIGTDVNFGRLTRFLFNQLEINEGVEIYLNSEVTDLKKQSNGSWVVEVQDLLTEENNLFVADFVFIGAGGGAISLLEKSNIEEAEGYGGFPISGQWLVCKNEKVIQQHFAKVYGKAAVGSPPMSVPHLDTRFIDGKKSLLFGPFAGFSTKFLKNGSYLDLPLSIEMDNIVPMIAAGWKNIPLTKYLIEQVTQSPEDRFEALLAYFPNAVMEDWELAIAGQRVQVIKKDKDHGGVLEFGTEIVAAADGSIAALLGASPGASTAVSAMLDVLKKCFVDEMETIEWKNRLKEIFPNLFEEHLDDEKIIQNRNWTNSVLFPQLNNSL